MRAYGNETYSHFLYLIRDKSWAQTRRREIFAETCSDGCLKCEAWSEGGFLVILFIFQYSEPGLGPLYKEPVLCSAGSSIIQRWSPFGLNRIKDLVWVLCSFFPDINIILFYFSVLIFFLFGFNRKPNSIHTHILINNKNTISLVKPFIYFSFGLIE